MTDEELYSAAWKADLHINTGTLLSDDGVREVCRALLELADKGSVSLEFHRLQMDALRAQLDGMRGRAAHAEMQRDGANAECDRRLEEIMELRRENQRLEGSAAENQRLRDALGGLLDKLTGYEHHPEVCSRTAECDEADEDECGYCGNDPCPPCDCGLAETQRAIEAARAVLAAEKTP